MKDPVFWRLVWKEYRFQRGFWISMVVIALLVHLCVLAAAGKDVDKARTFLEIAWALSAAYALGCGATLFATEHEAETYDFQRALPVSAGARRLPKPRNGVPTRRHPDRPASGRRLPRPRSRRASLGCACRLWPR